MLSFLNFAFCNFSTKTACIPESQIIAILKQAETVAPIPEKLRGKCIGMDTSLMAGANDA